MDPKQLARRLDEVSGRVAPRDDTPAADAERAFARRLLQARAATRHADCPKAALRRAQSLFHERPAGSWKQLLTRVRGAAPAAARGARTAPAVTRFEGNALTVDLQIAQDRDGTRRVLVAVVDERRADGLALSVLIPPARTARAVALDPAGTGAFELPGRAREIVLILRDKRGERARSPRIPLD